tara:strand:- start:63794 stop:64273 length:480 start_codon:yes stop_codon:yes gene_type:complete
MSIFKKLLDGVTGGFVSTAVDTFKDYFPPDMSAEQIEDLELRTKKLQSDIQQQMDNASNIAEELLTNRIAQLEGTASDLKSVPIVGPLVLFLRGLQRPLWGYATLFMDYMWFSEWPTLTSKQESALMAINILVLGFLFGERAIKNVMPLITKLFEAKAK